MYLLLLAMTTNLHFDKLFLLSIDHFAVDLDNCEIKKATFVISRLHFYLSWYPLFFPFFFSTQMTHQDLQQILYPQLSANTFETSTTVEAVDDTDELNETPVVPATTETTVRVTRPLPPIDFILPRALSSERELMDLAFR